MRGQDRSGIRARPVRYNNRMPHPKHALIVFLLSLLPSAALAQNATTPGTVTTPYPTLINLSVEWAISGDDNNNGAVGVRFRQTGAAGWRDALPLRRVPAGSTEGFSWDNKHSGSILDLEPDTEYEIELALSDPDGGSDTRTVTARTRPVPQAAANATVKPATPATFSSVASGAQPGDIILLADGDYSGFTFQHDGTAAQPIVIRAENPKGAVFNGEVRLDSRSYVYLEDLTVNEMIKFNNSVGIVVRGCTVNTPDSGIVSMSNGVENGYFCDNTVLGPTGWSDASVGASGDNLGEGIQVTGPGNVICYNYVKGYRDCISTMEDGNTGLQVCIDIYNNDVYVGADDGIELAGGRSSIGFGGDLEKRLSVEPTGHGCCRVAGGDKEHQIGLFGLGAGAADGFGLDAVGVVGELEQAGGINQPDRSAFQEGLLANPVSRRAGRVVDDADRSTDQGVGQRALADVGRAD